MPAIPQEEWTPTMHSEVECKAGAASLSVHAPRVQNILGTHLSRKKQWAINNVSEL